MATAVAAPKTVIRDPIGETMQEVYQIVLTDRLLREQ
jgi:hypothetical protein